MDTQAQIAALDTVKAFFDRSTACFEEDDSEFAPKEGMFTVAQHVAHTAQAMEWFFEGAFLPKGMNTDFAALEEDVRRVTSLADAMTWWNDAYEGCTETLRKTDPDAWDEPIRGSIMAGEPRHAIISGISDHCAHHRGALAVYARLCGREPAMPYG